MHTQRIGFALALSLTVTAAAFAQTSGNSGFLSDYSRLQPSSSNDLTQYYLAPGAKEKLDAYDSIMIDNPEIFLANDSPYKGIKPARLNVIAETFRESVSKALSADYKVVETPGPKALYLRLALVDLSVKKGRFHILGYTPAGLVFRGARQLTSSDYENAVRHTSLLGLKIEGEVRDSESSEVLGEFVDDYASEKTPENWKDLLGEMQRFGAVISCQLKNGRSAADDQVNCRADG